METTGICDFFARPQLPLPSMQTSQAASTSQPVSWGRPLPFGRSRSAVRVKHHQSKELQVSRAGSRVFEPFHGSTSDPWCTSQFGVQGTYVIYHFYIAYVIYVIRHNLVFQCFGSPAGRYLLSKGPKPTTIWGGEHRTVAPEMFSGLETCI